MSGKKPVLDLGTLPYAGFWRRAGAFIADIIIINALLFGITFLYGYMCGVEASTATAAEAQEIITRLNRFSVFATWAVLIFYFALFESSALQATPGKLLFKMKVYSRTGRLSFARALLRVLAKFLSAAILGVGFIMAAFTAKKQALHDFVVNSYVLKNI